MFTAVWFMSAAGMWAQNDNIIKSLERDVPGQGKVTVYQDPAVATLLEGKHKTSGEQKVLRMSGYRVQAYAGNNTRKAKTEAYHVADKIKAQFPDLPIYTTFIPPRWLCRVGDFRTIEEADATMRKLRGTGEFKEVSIVKDQINIPL